MRFLGGPERLRHGLLSAPAEFLARPQEDRPERGVFSTRSPHRPNPLSLHTVTLLSVVGNVLRVRGMDAIDGTPILDIKPYFPEFDRIESPVVPEWVGRLMRGYF